MAAPTKVTALDAPLTPQEVEYVKHRGLGLTPTQSAKAAGYSYPSKHATNLERRPRIAAAIERIHLQLREEMKIERQDVVNGFLEAIEYAKRMDDAGNMIAAWREIGKMLGHYEPEVKRIEVSENQKRLTTKLEGLSDNELLALMKKEQHTALMDAIDGEWEEVTDDPDDESFGEDSGGDS